MKNFIFFLLLIFILPLSTFAQSTETYDIEFESVWESVADNSTDGISTIDLPGNAHWSALVGATHITTNTFLMMERLLLLE